MRNSAMKQQDQKSVIKEDFCTDFTSKNHQFACFGFLRDARAFFLKEWNLISMFMGEIQPVKSEIHSFKGGIPLIMGENSLFKGERSKLRAKPERLER